MDNLHASGTSCSPTLSPYELVATPYGYEFVTKDGTRYSLSFIKIDDFYPLYSFSIDRLSEEYCYDERVRVTIVGALKKFFEHELNAMLYACDVSDGKHFARYRLFSKWLEPYADEYLRESYCVDDLLSSIIVRRDNPLAKDMIDIFKDLYKSMVES